MLTFDPGPTLTVAAALAEAEAWSERGALLSLLAFELTELVDSTDGRIPPLLIQRLIGGETPANPSLVESVRRELLNASERAKEKAREFLAATAQLSSRTVVLDFEGRSVVEPPIDYGSLSVPELSYECVGNPAHAKGAVQVRPQGLDEELDCDGPEGRSP